eukprot:2506829-Heterocapsa_arctica.AAC.1
MVDQLLPRDLGVPAGQPPLLLPRAGVPRLQHVDARIPRDLPGVLEGHRGPLGDSQPKDHPSDGRCGLLHRVALPLRLLVRVGLHDAADA